jgi:hypothetical protein
MTKKESDPVRTQLIVGILGFVGVLLTVLATVFGPIVQENLKQKNLPTQTPIVIVATPTTQAQVVSTDTVPAGDPTSTAAPATNTPEPTLAAVPVDIGKDWATGCISALWKLYPTDTSLVDKGNGCWQEPVHTFSADAGSLFLVSQRDANGPVEVYGLFAPLPENGKVSFTIRLKKLDDVDFVMGVFAEPDVYQAGLLMSVPYGKNMKNLKILELDNITDQNGQGTIDLEQANGFPISFTFSESSVKGTVEPFVYLTDPFPLPSAQKWLFLGYRSREGAYNVDVEILDLKLE